MKKKFFLFSGLFIILYTNLTGMNYKFLEAQEILRHFSLTLCYAQNNPIDLSAPCDAMPINYIDSLAMFLNSKEECPYQYFLPPVDNPQFDSFLSDVYASVALPMKYGKIAFANDTVIKIFNTNSGELIQKLKYQGEAISCLAQLGNDEIVSASFDGTIKVWDLLKNKAVLYIDGHTEYVSKLYPINDHIIISSSGDGAIKTWDLLTGKCIKKVVFESPIRNFYYYSDDNFAVSLDDFSVHACDQVYQKILNGHDNFICGLIQVQNKILISASCDGTIKFWDLVTHTCLKTASNDEKSICSMILLSCGDFATISKNGIIEIRSSTTGEIIRRYNCGPGISMVQQKNGDLYIFGKKNVSVLRLYPKFLHMFFQDKIDEEIYFNSFIHNSKLAFYNNSPYYVALLMQLERHRRRHEIVNLHKEWAELFEMLPACYKRMYEKYVIIEHEEEAVKSCIIL